MGPERSKYCDLCHQDIKPRGYTTHCKACEKKAEKQRQNQHFVDSIQAVTAGPSNPRQMRGDHADAVLGQRGQRDISPGAWDDLDNMGYNEHPSLLDADISERIDLIFQVDNIKREYHPSSGMASEVHAFDDFKRHPTPSTSSTPPDKQPWALFKLQLEFEIAELALEACLNNEQTDHLIKFCNRCASRQEKFTFQNHKDIRNMWDAVSHRITGVVFFHKPFTANTFWNVQSQLPPGGKPLAFILYADKTRLSSFGTARGYPVVARLANLPTDIHNGQGVGGGYVVGWLPIVKEDRDHASKPSWVNFKNAVWHESFVKILSSLASKSHTGQWFECLNNVQHWFFPFILILSADYEEQCIMSLIRGIKCLWPCPVCLVPHDELMNTLKCYPYRMSAQSQEVLQAARSKQTAEEKEEKLKEYGLRDLINAFAAVMYTDKIISSLGRTKVAQVDKNYEAFPHWRNLKHLAQVMSISFADGSMYKDISKMVIHATHAILTEDECPLGYLLLRCIRLFLELDMYAALQVHTTETISAGRHAIQAFSTYLQQYIDKSADESDKNWNFPKLHMSSHIFDNVEAKGATRNYNTKPNEKMHGPLKDLYLLRTNFRNVAPQILRINHWQVAAESIRRHISDLDEYKSQDSEDSEDPDDADNNLVPSNDTDSPHVKLGSRQVEESFESIEDAHKEDIAFTNFQTKLDEFLTNFLLAIQLPLPGGNRIQLRASDKVITECRFLKVNYESMVDWRQHTDYLRCSPKFYGRPHFNLGDITLPLALVHLFDAPTGVWLQKDKHLNFYHVRARPWAQAEFFQPSTKLQPRNGSWNTQDPPRAEEFTVHHTLHEPKSLPSTTPSESRRVYCPPDLPRAEEFTVLEQVTPIIHQHVAMSGNDSDDDWDEGNVADPISIIPGPNASKGDLMDALKAMQLEIQRLWDDNCTLKENNKVLVAEKPKWK
ncbi:hypothetical protein F4604DRAFT_1922961 [Suillus subluteus]|nr:hypothetical protein F4604DRAFT_1922961 [Suillus subluteus]